MSRPLRCLLGVVLGAGAMAAWGLAHAAPQAADVRLLDELIGRHVAPAAAPGAAAVVVRRDGGVSLRGYGVADLATQVAVDAESTVFRIGSISKTFTALALLQLVDEGKVELEADANRYLKGVQIPSGGAPVRVIDLLTHRSGFDGELTFVGVDDAAAAARSSDARLQRDIHRLRRAGEVAVYDNMAWGLLGHIVESVDGVPFAQALARRILQPLGMKHTQVGLPGAAAGVAVAHEVGADGLPHARPQIHLRRGWQGAGDVSTSAGDMALLLQALLDDGRHPGGRLLTAATFKRFADTAQYSLHPGLPGTGLGVYALGAAGGGAYGHGGTIRGFNAVFMVLPQQGIAFFAVMNLNKPTPELSLGGLLDYVARPPGKSPIDPTDYLIIDVPDLLAQRLQPPARPASVASAASAASAAQADWSGRYAGLRAESYEALLPRVAAAVFLAPRPVHTLAGGALQIGGLGPYQPIGADLFALDPPAGPLATTFGFASVGTDAVMAPHTLQASRRLSWYERPLLTVGGLLLAPLLLIAVPLLHWWLAKAGSARHDGVLALAALVVVAGLAAELSSASLLQRVLDQGWLVTAWRSAINAALLAIAACAALGLWRAWRTAPDAGAWRPGRVHATTMAAFATWLLLSAAHWQVLGKF
jgi:CubicO group peptidase (beta-lactamase class C family)